MMARHRLRPAGQPDERGAFLIVWAVLLIGLMTMVAILIDLSGLRSSRRADQTVADVAALAAGKNLGDSNPTGACEDAITSFNANAPSLSSTIDPVAFCTQQTNNNVGSTTCSSGGTLAEAQPQTTVGRYTVSVHYPVPASEISDTTYGSGLNDGIACQRLRVIVKTTDRTLFGAVVGASSLSTTRSATVKPAPTTAKIVPALWLLDPYGCVSLSVTGGSQVLVGQTSGSTVPGVVSIDSDGSQCTGSQETIESNGSASNANCNTGTCIQAVPTSGSNAGSINLFALPSGATTCSGYACSQGDVSSDRIQPQPVPASQRATRAPVDWLYNCKSTYPAYTGGVYTAAQAIPIAGCPNTSTTPPYIDNLNATGVAGSKNPDDGSNADTTYWKKWTGHYGGSACSPSSMTVPAGNWWIDCPNFSISNGVTVKFTGGNIVLDGNLKMTGGELDVNTTGCSLPIPSPPPDSQDANDPCTPSNPSSNLSGTCLAPVSTPCLDYSSDLASFLYLRSGGISLSGGGNLHLNHVTVYQVAGSGNDLKDTGGAPPVWLGSLEGPFSGLAYWSETSSNGFSLAGGANVALEGTFFTPDANSLSLSGGGNWGQQNAQFISFSLAVSGGGSLEMTPNFRLAVKPPAPAGVLIR